MIAEKYLRKKSGGGGKSKKKKQKVAKGRMKKRKNQKKEKPVAVDPQQARLNQITLMIKQNIGIIKEKLAEVEALI